MPLYDYRCPNGHTREELCKYEARDLPLPCPLCFQIMTRILSAHHKQPDGLYSHDPNLGDEAKFQRNLEGIERLKAKIATEKDAHHPRSGY